MDKSYAHGLVHYWTSCAIWDMPPLPDVSPIPFGQPFSPSATTIYMGILSPAALADTLGAITLDTPDFPVNGIIPQEKVYLIKFELDEHGRYVPDSLMAHVCLAAIKAHEVDGTIERLHTHYTKMETALRKKLVRAASVDHLALGHLAEWLSHFLPRDAAFDPVYGQLPTASPPMGLGTRSDRARLRTLLPLCDPGKITPSVRKCLRFLAGRGETMDYRPDYLAPIWPSDDAEALHPDHRYALSMMQQCLTSPQFHLYTCPVADAASTDNVVLGLAARYLVTLAQRTPRPANLYPALLKRLPEYPLAKLFVGFTVFSADGDWLSHLAARIEDDLSPAPGTLGGSYLAIGGLDPAAELAAPLRQAATRRLPASFGYRYARDYDIVWPGILLGRLHDNINENQYLLRLLSSIAIRNEPFPIAVRETFKHGFVPSRLLEKLDAKTIVSPSHLQTIADKLESTLARDRKDIVMQAVGYLRALLLLFARFYVTVAEKQVPVTFYNKHLSFLHPFQMIAFEDTPAYLDRLQGGKQYVAVLDCREAPDPLLLVRICQHFTKIILLNATHHDINLWDIPFPLRTALRKKMIAFSEGV